MEERGRWAPRGASSGPAAAAFVVLAEEARTLPILGEATISCKRKRTLRIDEFTYEIICWLFTKIDKRALLDDVAFVHEHDFITEICCFRQIVSDEERCLTQARENFFELLLQRSAHQWIERAQRFVKEEQFGRKHQCAHQTDALTLTAGKFDWISREQIAGKSCQLA